MLQTRLHNHGAHIKADWYYSIRYCGVLIWVFNWLSVWLNVNPVHYNESVLQRRLWLSRSLSNRDGTTLPLANTALVLTVSRNPGWCTASHRWFNVRLIRLTENSESHPPHRIIIIRCVVSLSARTLNNLSTLNIVFQINVEITHILAFVSSVQ